MKSKIMCVLRSLILFLCLAPILCGCHSTPTEPVSQDVGREDLRSYLTSKIDERAVLRKLSWENMSGTDSEQNILVATVGYDIGDVFHDEKYQLTYDYNRALGWQMSQIDGVDTDQWKVSATEFTGERILKDLEGVKYFSGYSDGIFENKRVLDCSIDSQELNAQVGYNRITLTATLNADNVHEILAVFCEYVLDDTNSFILQTSSVTLENVSVQGGISDELLKNSLLTVNFYREEETSTWRLGELQKISYETLSDNLSMENNQEIIEVSFRGEGQYMSVSGCAMLEFRFSSGWYLYDSNIIQNSVSTEMLVDTWKVDADIVTDTIINDRPFNFDTIVDLPVTEDMISDMQITDYRVSDNGKFQTAYFAYLLHVNRTVFHITGYGKYDLEDGFLALSTWNELVSTVDYDLSGTWSGDDVNSLNLQHYTLTLTDPGTGIFTGRLDSVGVDLRKDPNYILTGSVEVEGNLTQSNHFSMMDKEWLKGDFTLGLCIPRGYYDYVHDVLVCENARYGYMFLSRGDSAEFPESTISRLIQSGGIQKYIEGRVQKKKQDQALIGK